MPPCAALPASLLCCCTFCFAPHASNVSPSQRIASYWPDPLTHFHPGSTHLDPFLASSSPSSFAVLPCQPESLLQSIALAHAQPQSTSRTLFPAPACFATIAPHHRPASMHAHSLGCAVGGRSFPSHPFDNLTAPTVDDLASPARANWRPTCLCCWSYDCYPQCPLSWRFVKPTHHMTPIPSKSVAQDPRSLMCPLCFL